jgi:hypothetical protein
MTIGQIMVKNRLSTKLGYTKIILQTIYSGQDYRQHENDEREDFYCQIE